MRSREYELSGGGTLLIRDMKPEDAADAARLERETFSLPWSEAAFREEIGGENRLFAAAFVDGAFAGYCGMIAVCDEGDITNVAVKESFRRKGIAKRMLQAVLTWGRQAGLCAFTLEVRKSNGAAIALYESLGFAAEGVRRNFYEKPREDALIMWKRQAAHVEKIGTTWNNYH